MSVNGYQFYDLSSQEVDKIKQLEGEISKQHNHDEEVILLAFKNNKQPKNI